MHCIACASFGSSNVWFVDNSAALSAMVKAGANAADVDRAAAVVALACATLQCRMWFEDVQSDSNWADGSSGLLGLCRWCRVQSFALRLSPGVAMVLLPGAACVGSSQPY